MPMGKIRSAKRSSGSSFSSTVTTIVLAGLCIYGIWALSSNDFISPSTTTRTSSTEKSSSSSSFSSSSSSDDSLPAKVVGKKSPPVFQDSQGNLPDDAIRHRAEGDAIPESQETKDPSQGDSDDTTANGDTGDNAGNGGGDKEEVAAAKDMIDSGGGDQNANGMKGEESKEEQEKQVNLQNQNSEESSVTQGQEAEKTTIVVDGGGKENERVNDSDAAGTTGSKEEEEKISNDKQDPVDPKKHVDEEEKSSPESQEPVDPKKHVITDEDQQKRLEQHQQKEDAQIKEGKKKAEQEGATSKDQEVHDESPVKDASKVNQPSDPEKDGNIPQESNESKKTWQTQKGQSENQKERRNDGTEEPPTVAEVKWQLCNTTAGPDYIPCLDNEKAIAKLRSRHHYEHRERHCPEDPPTCLVPVPQGYKKPVQWPQSRDKIWYHNVPHTLLAEVKGHQNWVKVSGEFLTFPGGGTQFIHGALHYIDFLQEAVPDIAWGKHSRVILDVGCGVASLGGFLFERDVLTMSFAPKDEHEAQVQFALERGIPAISAVMGTQRLPYPSRVFDVVHCARCRVPWHAEGGALLLELNRVLRPGGYFVWSATPVYQTLEEDVQIWKEMSNLTVSMCWELVAIKKDKLNSVGAAIYHKPDTNDCYDKRAHNQPPMCKEDDDPNAAWYVPLQSCMHRVPTAATERGTEWPEEWPPRLQAAPYWLNKSQNGIYGKPAPDDFRADTEHWKGEVSKLYLRGLGIDWTGVRNIMDMRAVYGGFAAALKDLKAWVMNVVNIDSPDTLPIIYERGLFGIYHDWCESFSTYPRTYDLLHADQLFSKLKKRCKLIAVVAEVDRIVRPGGKFIMRDDSHTVGEVELLLKSLHWEVRFTFSKNRKGILSAQKSEWRPDSYAPPS